MKASLLVAGVVAFLVGMETFADVGFPWPAVTQITSGNGNDTEAAWSPEGARIAFQTDRQGDLDICVLEVATGDVTTVVGGPGDACFPAWSPDGRRLVYAYSHPRGTAQEEAGRHGCNLFLIPAGGGTPRRLTSGLHRDITPTFDVTGEHVLFASTRGADKQASLRLYTVPVAGGEPELFHSRGGNRDAGFTQPDLSPDGSRYVVAFTSGLRDNWSVLTGLTASPGTTRKTGTGVRGPLYAPRWSPAPGNLLACTGYEPGVPGWQIYLVQAYGDGVRRVTDGPGNSRSPAWSPDGTALAFENNRSGRYKLYRLRVPRYEAPSVQDDPLRFVPRITASTGAESAPFAFDGELVDQSHWFCVGLEQWIEAHYPVPRTVDGVRVHSGFLAYHGNPSGAQCVAGYRVQAWLDGRWRDLVEPVTDAPRYQGEARSGFRNVHRFESVTSTRFRLVVTASHDTLRRVRSPHKPCVAPDKAATYIREIVFFRE